MSERTATPTLLDPADGASGELDDLLTGPVAVRTPRTHIGGVLVGRLVAFTEDGTVPLVTYEGPPTSAALRARATLDLHGAHIGRDVVLMFEEGDPTRPIVIGCLHEHQVNQMPAFEEHAQVDVDGERLIVTAKEQLVLRCGKASVTLTRAGKVLIEGAYVSSRATSVNRIRGGSVQLN